MLAVPALLIVLSAQAAPVGTGRADGGSVAAGLVVTVVGPPSRIGRELTQELTTSGFTVERLDRAAAAADAPAVAGTPRIVITIDDRNVRLQVQARSSDPDRARSSFDVHLHPDSRLAQRREFIALVERLRLLAAEIAAEPPEAVSPPVGNDFQTPAFDGRDAVALRVIVPSLRRWRLGAGLAMSSAGDDMGFTNHAAITGQYLPSRRIGAWTRLLWPLRESTRQTLDDTSRLWTFGGDVGATIDLLANPGGARDLCPYVNLGVGLRFLLADRTYASQVQSSTGRKTGGQVTAALGVRARLSERVRGFVQLESGRAGTFFSGNRLGREIDALSGWFAGGEVGVLFDY